MFLKSQLRKYAVEWIELLPSGKSFAVSELYSYLRSSFPDECDAAGFVPSGEPRETNCARFAIRDCSSHKVIKHIRHVLAAVAHVYYLDRGENSSRYVLTPRVV
jgi:hypothetical protein